MNGLKSRRRFLVAVGAGAVETLSGCTSEDSTGSDGSDSDSSDGNGSGSWQHDETVSSSEGQIHEFFAGELEEGDKYEVEVVVNRGRQARFEMRNNDTGEFHHTKFIYRARELMDEEEEGSDRFGVSPYSEKLEIPEFGEYYPRVLTPSDNMKVEFRFRVA